MSIGLHVVALEPESLRDELVQELKSLPAACKDEPGRTPRRRQGAEP